MKAELADSTWPGLPVATPGVLLSALEGIEARRPELTVNPGRKAVSAWSLLRAGLLRQACGLTFKEIALRAGISTSQAHVQCDLHRRQVLADEEYASISSDALRQAVGALRLHESSLQGGG
jgi:hypothetical protein